MSYLPLDNERELEVKRVVEKVEQQPYGLRSLAKPRDWEEVKGKGYLGSTYSNETDY